MNLADRTDLERATKQVTAFVTDEDLAGPGLTDEDIARLVEATVDTLARVD